MHQQCRCLSSSFVKKMILTLSKCLSCIWSIFKKLNFFVLENNLFISNFITYNKINLYKCSNLFLSSTISAQIIEKPLQIMFLILNIIISSRGTCIAKIKSFKSYFNIRITSRNTRVSNLFLPALTPVPKPNPTWPASPCGNVLYRFREQYPRLSKPLIHDYSRI